LKAGLGLSAEKGFPPDAATTGQAPPRLATVLTAGPGVMNFLRIKGAELLDGIVVTNPRSWQNAWAWLPSLTDEDSAWQLEVGKA
jgi:hypothetical protein